MSHVRSGFAFAKKVSATLPFPCIAGKPTKRRPILKPRSYLRQVEFGVARPFPKGMSHCLSKRLPTLYGKQEVVFVDVQTAEVNGIVHAVDGEKNARGLQFRDG